MRPPCSFVRILMIRDHFTREEAEASLREAREMVADGADPEAVLYDEFDLDPDYVDDLLFPS